MTESKSLPLRSQPCEHFAEISSCTSRYKCAFDKMENSKWVIYGSGGAENFDEIGPFDTMEEAKECLGNLHDKADEYNNCMSYTPYDKYEYMIFFLKQISLSNKEITIKEIDDVIEQEKKCRAIRKEEYEKSKAEKEELRKSLVKAEDQERKSERMIANPM